jgi:hypothetical protein
MAMAWLIWRSNDAVIEASDAYRAKWMRWDTKPRREETLGDSFWAPVSVGRASLAELIRHPDNRHLPIDRLFDPSQTDLTRAAALSEYSPFYRLSYAAEIAALNATAESAVNGRRSGTRQPFSFLINYLREQLRRAVRRQANISADGALLDPPISRDVPDFVTSDGIAYFDIRVPKDEVIKADLEASRIEYDWPSWTTEHVLGWIAYRSATTFRLVAPLDRHDSARSLIESRLGFQYPAPDLSLLSALRNGRIRAFHSIEVMHSAPAGPINQRWWNDHTLLDSPHVRFIKSDILEFWAIGDTGVSATLSVNDVSSDRQKVPLLETVTATDPWQPSTKLTLGESRVIKVAKALWPECKCALRVYKVYEEIAANWDEQSLGPMGGDQKKTISRALRKIPAWNDRHL